MPLSEVTELDAKSPPFDQFKGITPLTRDRSGRGSGGHARHHLYVARDKQTGANLFIKLTSRPGLIYQRDLANEIATLTTINRELPESRYFPVLGPHGTLRDGRTFLVMSQFDELPLATSIASERIPDRTVTHLKTAIEIATALSELHGIGVVHVDLNPMNILYKANPRRPTIRIVDFESSYEQSRHGSGEFFNPATTTGYSAPEITTQAPDARADVYSLGAVLYTMLAGFDWTVDGRIDRRVAADRDLDAELKETLLHATAVEPERRFRAMTDLRVALVGYLDRIWPGRSW